MISVLYVPIIAHHNTPLRFVGVLLMTEGEDQMETAHDMNVDEVTVTVI